MTKQDFTKPYSPKRPLVDPKVHALAEWWMLALNHAWVTDDEIWQLAGEIQTVCEDAARELEARQPKRDTP